MRTLEILRLELVLTTLVSATLGAFSIIDLESVRFSLSERSIVLQLCTSSLVLMCQDQTPQCGQGKYFSEPLKYEINLDHIYFVLLKSLDICFVCSVEEKAYIK